MLEAKYKIEVYSFAYNKIIGNVRKIDIRPYKKYLHDIKIGDVIEYVNIENKESVYREVKGIALFNSFDTMINMLPSQLIGYDNIKEVKLRVKRMYTKQDEEEYGVVAIFIDEPKKHRVLNFRALDRAV